MIHAIGDSFTYGDELECKNLAWPTILSNKLHKHVANLGRPASGNTRIVKRLINCVLDKSDLVIIGWSDCNRQEFADEIGVYDIWAGRNYRAIQLDDPTHRINLIKYVTAYDVPEYYYANWLRQILLAQSFCEVHNVRCVMFIACGSHQSHQIYHSKHKTLIDAIDHSMFVDGMFTSVGEWTYGLPHGPGGHPLEQGHEIIAEKIYEHIRNKCWLS